MLAFTATWSCRSSTSATRPIRRPFLRIGVFGPMPGASRQLDRDLVVLVEAGDPLGGGRAVERDEDRPDDRRGEHDDADSELFDAIVHGGGVSGVRAS